MGFENHRSVSSFKSRLFKFNSSTFISFDFPYVKEKKKTYYQSWFKVDINNIFKNSMVGYIIFHNSIECFLLRKIYFPSPWHQPNAIDPLLPVEVEQNWCVFHWTELWEASCSFPWYLFLLFHKMDNTDRGGPSAGTRVKVLQSRVAANLEWTCGMSKN